MKDQKAADQTALRYGELSSMTSHPDTHIAHLAGLAMVAESELLKALVEQAAQDAADTTEAL